MGARVHTCWMFLPESSGMSLSRRSPSAPIAAGERAVIGTDERPSQDGENTVGHLRRRLWANAGTKGVKGSTTFFAFLRGRFRTENVACWLSRFSVEAAFPVVYQARVTSVREAVTDDVLCGR
jgi:hypothetical protein